MFNFIKEKLTKIYTTFTSKAHAIFSQSSIDQQALKELEILLINADTGVKTTRLIINSLEQKFNSGNIVQGQDLQYALEQQLIELLPAQENTPSNIYLLVGINGSGKTTFAGKLAHQLMTQNKKVLLVAADTFRAAATEQLKQWATHGKIDIVIGNPEQDPASVVFAGCERFKHEQYDILVIDTAGRLQTKVNLMKELEKIKRIIVRQLPEKKCTTLLTIDAMLGQNSFEQAKLFHECTSIDGIVLTKMDGTGKGGIVVAINQELHIPVTYISYGEKLEHLKPFNAQEYVKQLLSE